MSLIIAYKLDNSIVVKSDSIIDRGGFNFSIHTPKVFQPCEGLLVGCVGAFRLNSFMHSNFVWEKYNNPSVDQIIHSIPNAIFTEYRDFTLGCCEDGSLLYSEYMTYKLMFVSIDGIFLSDDNSDYSIGPISDDVVCMGVAEDYALGAIESRMCFTDNIAEAVDHAFRLSMKRYASVGGKILELSL